MALEQQVCVKVVRRFLCYALLAQQILDDQTVMVPDTITRIIKQIYHRLLWCPDIVHREWQPTAQSWRWVQRFHAASFEGLRFAVRALACSCASL